MKTFEVHMDDGGVIIVTATAVFVKENILYFVMGGWERKEVAGFAHTTWTYFIEVTKKAVTGA